GGHKASEVKFQSYLSKQPISIVIINGHGGPSEVAGKNNEIILSTTNGCDLLKGKKVFIRACDAGTALGPALMKAGAQGFIGYSQPFIFARDPDSLHTPLTDEYAAPVLECSNQVGISLIKGKNIYEAQQESLSKYRETIDKFSNSKTAHTFILPFLLWNMSCQICYC
ncbi:hypothetical protein KW807_01440, partial [Candidatus Parcubacteria bacterium]|nr:hypothetical protein [Candidatus Parcubacteria bacterium]